MEHDCKAKNKEDCDKCQNENNMPYDFCCLKECGEHEFCKGCNKK